MGQDRHGIELAGATHVGRYRKRNEDSFALCLLGDPPALLGSSLPTPHEGWMPAPAGGRIGTVDPADTPLLLAVADGVGGGPGGDIASRLAVTLFPEEVARRLRAAPDTGEIPQVLTDAALSAHEQVLESGRPDTAHSGMASTLTAWLAMGSSAWLVQVGDSRCYRLRDGTLTLLSTDQTLAQDLVDDGTISDLNAVADIYHNTLTSTVGGHSSRPVVTALDRQPGDVLVVCSDGITKHVDDERLAHMMGAPMAPEEMLAVLFEAVLEDGATDNLTAIVARELG